MLCNLSNRPIGLCDFIITHLNSNHALLYNKLLKIEIYFLDVIIVTYLESDIIFCDYITCIKHLNSNHAFLYNKPLKIET